MDESERHRAGRVAGKAALVVGAGSGIGRATAVLLAREGAAVACADIDAAAARATADDIRATDARALELRLDVTTEADWRNAVERTIAELGGLDILVNSAGISFTAPVDEMRLEDWQRVMAVNADGAFLGVKHAVAAMRRLGRGGSIVNVSSASGIKASAGASAYCASKAAVCLLSRAAALECRDRGDGIRINCVLPGGVKTPLWRTMPFFQKLMAERGSEEAAFAAMAAGAEHARFAEPEEIALGILYLASDEARYVTATELVMDNGFRA